MKMTHCYICGASVPDIEGPVSERAYLPQSPGCWKFYTDILEREYSEWRYPDIHRLTVDCYAAQHPTREANEKSAQSITIHLVGIYLAVEKEIPLALITPMLKTIVDKHKSAFDWLEPPANLGDITVADVHTANNLDEHTSCVIRWGLSVWNAWEEHRPYIKSITDEHMR